MCVIMMHDLCSGEIIYIVIIDHDGNESAGEGGSKGVGIIELCSGVGPRTRKEVRPQVM